MVGASGKAGSKVKARGGKRATKREMALRDLRIMERLAAGLTTAEVAAREGLSPRRMRELTAKMFARRSIDPPAQCHQLQIRRLSEALLVSYSAMGGGNLKAVDRVVKIVRELDRYYGFSLANPAYAPIQIAQPSAAPALAPPAPEPALAQPQIFDAAANRVPSDWKD